MSYRLLLISGFTLLFWCAPSLADEADDLFARLQSELSGNDLDSALQTARRLEDLRLEQGEYEDAGAAAFTIGHIHGTKGDRQDAALAYDDCAAHYRDAGALPQALQCAFRAGAAYAEAGRHATAMQRYTDTINTLESADQHRTGFAASVYLARAKAVLPSKLRRLKGATQKRKAAISDAESAILALDMSGLRQSEHYAAALMLKGTAFEDLREYEAAIPVYKSLLDLYEETPALSRAQIPYILSRLSVVQHEASGGDSAKSVTVALPDGKEIDLAINRRDRVQMPRLHKNQLVDVASVSARIKLAADGSVADIEVLDSFPAPEFGEAFEKGVRTWTFIPPDGVSASDIPPFPYGMTFYVKRR